MVSVIVFSKRDTMGGSVRVGLGVVTAQVLGTIAIKAESRRFTFDGASAMCTKIFAFCIVASSAELAQGWSSKNSCKKQGFETHDDSAIISVRGRGSSNGMDVVKTI